MTDTEIIKAFNSLYRKILDCKYDLRITRKEFLALNNVHTLITRQQAEIERLKNENFILSQKRANIFEILAAFERGEAKGRADTVKEFANRLEKKAVYSGLVNADIVYKVEIDNIF